MAAKSQDLTASVQAVEALTGHHFAQPDLVVMALTHASAASNVTYERLEFLGDRVLGMAVADLLYDAFPGEAEGPLAKRLSSLVQGTTLAKIAQEKNLGALIVFSESELSAGGAENQHILADVVEAILGALYLDGGFDVCKDFVKSLLGDRLYKMNKPPQHPKTFVQEWAQGRGLSLPVYEVVEQSGPDHAPVFTVRLTVEGHKPFTADGKSRQEAEKAAAKLFMLQEDQ